MKRKFGFARLAYHRATVKMRGQLPAALGIVALVAFLGCRTHKEMVKADSIKVQQTQHSHTIETARDSTAESDSISIDMQGVKILVLPDLSVPADSGTALDTEFVGSAKGILGRLGKMKDLLKKENGLFLAADQIKISKGKAAVNVKESHSEKSDSSSQDSSAAKVKGKVVDKPPSGWAPMIWILAIFLFFIIAEYIRSKYKK